MRWALVSGWGVSHRVWDNMMSALRSLGQLNDEVSAVECYDLYGEALMHRLRTGSGTATVWVAWSLAGTRVLHLLHRYHRNKDSLVLMASTPYWLCHHEWYLGLDRRRLQRFKDQYSQHPMKGFQSFCRLYMPEREISEEDSRLHCPPNVALSAQLLNDFESLDARTCLAELDGPVLVILGARDKLFVEVNERTITHFVAAVGKKDLQVKVVQDAGHAMPCTHAQDLVAHILAWLRYQKK